MLRGDSYREVLANRSFLALWLGQALSHVGQSIIYVVVALYVYELTGSARQVSFAVALELLPLILGHPVSEQESRDRVAALQAELTAELPLELVAAAQERGLARDLEATAGELLAKLEG